MKTQMPKKDRVELLGRLAALMPFAKGSVCVSHKPCGNPWKCKKCLSGEMHPSVQYSFRKTGFGSQGEAAMADREILQSVMETLHLRHEDPVGVLAEALKAYKPKFARGMSAAERQKAKDVAAERVVDILFPRNEHMKPKRA